MQRTSAQVLLELKEAVRTCHKIPEVTAEMIAFNTELRAYIRGCIRNHKKTHGIGVLEYAHGAYTFRILNMFRSYKLLEHAYRYHMKKHPDQAKYLRYIYVPADVEFKWYVDCNTNDYIEKVQSRQEAHYEMMRIKYEMMRVKYEMMRGGKFKRGFMKALIVTRAGKKIKMDGKKVAITLQKDERKIIMDRTIAPRWKPLQDIYTEYTTALKTGRVQICGAKRGRKPKHERMLAAQREQAESEQTLEEMLAHYRRVEYACVDDAGADADADADEYAGE
jgi:hypothetical protein